MEEEVMEYHSQVKAPRLCVMKREDIGYGFNLHGEKGVVGQYISAVDPGGAADKAGLCIGDRVIEVNGVNVENCKHNEVVERIRSDPTQTALLVIDQVTDKYLASIGKPITADLANLASVTELYTPEECSSKNINTEKEIVEKLEDLQCSEKEISENRCEVNGDNVDDIQNSSGDKNKNETDEGRVFHKQSIEHEKVGEKPSEGTEYVEENLRSESTERVVERPVSTATVDGKPSEKLADTEYYTDESSVNILAGVECEDNTSLSLKTDTPNNSRLGSYEKVRPNTVPMRKEVKQGDWREKLALFDQL